MMKRTMVVWVAVFFSSLFLMAGCAKKAVKTEEAAKPAAPKVEAAKPADDAAARKVEDARLAKVRELEKAQRLRAEIQAFESEHVYFDYDKSELKPEAQVGLKKKAEWLRANPQFGVKIEGHCDERGTNEYNLALGDRRAQAAAKYLGSLGMSMSRIATISYGEERPAAPGHNEKAWAKNRRDEFKLSK